MSQYANSIEGIEETLDELGDETETDYYDKLPSDIDDKEGETTSQKNLGIMAIDESNFPDWNFSWTISEKNDFEGFILVIIKICIKNRCAKEKKFKITGYQNLETWYDQRIKNCLKFVFDSKSKHKDKLPSEISREFKKLTYQDLGIRNFSIDDNDIEVYFLAKEIKDDDGEMQVNAVLSIDKQGIQIMEEKKIFIFGFKKQSEADYETIEKFIKTLDKTKTFKTNKNEFLPSNIAIGDINSTKLGIKDQISTFEADLNEQKIIFNYLIIKIDNDQGELQVQVTLLRNKIKQNTQINISGFRTQHEQERIEMNFILKAIPKNVLTTKKNFLPSQIGKVGDILNQKELGVQILTDQQLAKFKITFKIEKLDDIKGTMTVLTTLFKGDESIPITNYITGFKVLRTKYQEDFDGVKSQFIKEQKTHQTNTLPLWIESQFATKDELGILEPVYDQNIMTFQYVIINSDNVNGIVKAKVIANRPFTEVPNSLPIKSEWNIKITNFKVQDSKDEEELIEAANFIKTYDFLTTKTTILPRLINLGITTIEKLGIKKPSQKVMENINFKTLEVKSFDDENGFLTVDVVLEKSATRDSAKRSFGPTKIIIKNFKTLKIQEQEDVDQVVSQLTDSTSNFSTIVPKFKIDKTYSAEQLGIDEIEDNKNTQIKYKLIANNVFEGLITVKAIVKKGQEAEGSKEIIISGYRTLKQQTEIDINQLLIQIDNVNTSEKSKLPSQITGTLTPQILGIKPIENPEKIIINYAVSTDEDSVNDTLGQLQVQVTASKAVETSIDQETETVSQTKKIIISRFKTLHEQAIEDVEFVIKSFVDSDTTINNFMPSKLDLKEVTPSSLGIEEIANNKNTTINYEIVEKNDILGKIYVKITVKKSTVEQQKVITISNFKTKKQQDKDDLTDLVGNTTPKITTSKNSNLPSEI